LTLRQGYKAELRGELIVKSMRILDLVIGVEMLEEGRKTKCICVSES